MGLAEKETPSVLECCRAAEARLLRAQQLLPDPAKVDDCIGELNEAAATLEALASASPSAWDPQARLTLGQIQKTATLVRAQIEHASNFWRGWLQLWPGNGYTDQGLPAMVSHEARSCFEG
jgi:hypothetical protein